MAALMSHPFPGNVRELENAVEHAFVVSTGRTIGLEDLPPSIRSGPVSVSLEASDDTPLLDGAEASVIRQALERHQGNRRLAAEELGISRSTLWRKMKRHRISGRGW
jgi:DNA-binding NtrC family response regulator